MPALVKHKVIKFGGSSLATPDCLKAVKNIIQQQKSNCDSLICVVSAFQGVTDQLIEISSKSAAGDETFRDQLIILGKRHTDCIQNLLPITEQSSALANLKTWLNDLDEFLQGIFQVGECSTRALDNILSYGERLSAFCLSSFISSTGIAAQYFDARELIKCDSNWGAGQVDFEATNQNISNCFEAFQSIAIVTGFIAKTHSNATITLGRGGSDYTCSIIGAALNCTDIQIWTDVDGVMTADPRKVSKAFSIPTLSYAEIMEMAHFGAKVVFPPTIQPALNATIKIHIKNTFNPSHVGTLIAERTSVTNYQIAGISSLSQIALLRLEGSGLIGIAGTAMRLFKSLAQQNISVILITQASSEHTICVAVMPEKSDAAKLAIENEFQLEINQSLVKPVLVEKELSIVSVIGEGMRSLPGISAKVFGALGSNGVNVKAIAQGSSELNISVVIDKVNESKALNALHDVFFLSENKTLNLFITGTGLIARELLQQINARQEALKDEMNLELAIRGITNSRHCLVSNNSEEILNSNSVFTDLEKSQHIALDQFIKKMLALNLPNSVFIDCTASTEVTQYYQEILDHSIAIVTPNKKAQTGTYQDYITLKKTGLKRSTSFLYETSVGAGLPVISTLNDLIKSGDQVIKIEAVLSGTLSYIFNSFDKSLSFSQVVKKAQSLGYTEPDPREDLCGADFARKLLILGREAGFKVELSDVHVENLVPESCRNINNVADFFMALEKEDRNFETLLKNATSKGHKLCYMGSVRANNLQVSLQSIPSTHPFYSLSGSDNIVAFTTTRYLERPLVVKGPGAGAEVTAAGVFADIIRLA